MILSRLFLLCKSHRAARAQLLCAAALAAVLGLLSAPRPAAGQEAEARPTPTQRTLDINEYRVEGADHLDQLEVEEALAPFLGPGRVLEDVEKARVALERAYSDKGYQAVTVAIPPQKVRAGVVTLRVTESKVGRLRVHGSHWFSLQEIKSEAPSLAEGAVPNFNDVVRDIVVLNQLPDRHVTPALRAGVLPNTVDVDLNVTDRVPLHGSLEFNNRYSAGTSAQRLSGSFRYDNLWQAGHSLSLGFQTAPNRFSDARIFSATYLIRFLSAPWLTVSFNGVIQDSDVSTLGDLAVKGRGRTLGTRVGFLLPGPGNLFHGLTVGLDYKAYGKEIEADTFGLPITYLPASLQYTAALAGASSQTQASATLTFGLRGLGSGDAAFDARRYKATGSFFSSRLELSRTEELGGGLQLFGKVTGFFSQGPLIPSEQQTAGGLDSVRGYLEAQAAGDRAVIGSVELRSPSAAGFLGDSLRPLVDDFRLLVFADGARVALRDPLPEQQWLFLLWSAGGGASFKLLGHLGGAFDLGVPLRSEGTTSRHHPRLQFRLTGEF